MGKQIGAVVLLVVMVGVIVSVDVLFLRHHFAARLASNIGIVAVCLAIYFAFLRRS
jgi:hypothetical protein